MQPQNPLVPTESSTNPAPSGSASSAPSPTTKQPTESFQSNPVLVTPQPQTYPNQAASNTAGKPPYNPAYTVPSEIQDYHQVPVFRRRWLVVLITLIVVPIGAIIVWTGDVYLQNQKTKQVYKFTNRQKIVFTLGGVIIIANNILRLTQR